jgi:subtilisin family serine protease
MKEFMMKMIVAAIAVLNLVFTVRAQEKTDWFNLSYKEGILAGAEVDDALKLIGNRKLDTIVVAVIDDGVDIYHEDLAGKIWINEDEIPDNEIDDDQNGYIDDVHGWNFLGNPEGENIKYETLELTRLYRQYSERFEGRDENSISEDEADDYREFLKYKSEFEKELSTIEAQYSEYAQLTTLYNGALAFYADAVSGADSDENSLDDWQPETPDGVQVKNFLMLAEKEGLDDYLEDAGEYFESYLDYNLNVEFDPRPLVNEAELPIGYGNNMVWAEDPGHGTHVAGIIAAVRDNEKGINGIAPNAVIMPVRAIPGGDERDKDVALAIRYAVDNGANIINMSFGKSYSPEADLVYEAIRYAEKSNVLLIHAAGNDASDNDVSINYPDGTIGKKKSAKTFITVAASGVKPDEAYLTDFSNFGKNSVDIIAPGLEIRSLAPENGTASQSGTSMAAPVVSGVAALIWGLDSSLSAKKLKKLLIKSANDLEDLTIKTDEVDVSLSDLLRNPVVISAENAAEKVLQ